jgi:pre-mRNA-splicing helicase BRR2
MEDDDRNELLQMEPARFCNHYPSIEVAHQVTTSRPTVGEPIEIEVQMERENDINGLAPPVVAPFYPQKRKEEGWWLVIGDPENNQLFSIKRYVRK